MSVEERLARLEKSVRLWRWSSGGLGAAVLLLVGATAIDYLGFRGTVQARRIVVRNDQGAAVEIETSPSGDGVVSVNDAKNLTRVLMGTSQRGFGTVELYGGGDQKMVFLGGSGSGGQITVFNNEKKKVVDVQATKTNCGAVIVSDFDGHQIHGLSGDQRR
ncbi:MAG: hypothetical protein ACT4QC_01355 [Planctomycetaceae bacterium]